MQTFLRVQENLVTFLIWVVLFVLVNDVPPK